MKEYSFNIGGNNYNVVVNSMSGNVANVTVNGVSYQVGIQNKETAALQENTSPATAVVSEADHVQQTGTRQVTAGSSDGKAVNSPLPGVIISVNVNVGDQVKAGQEVAVLEAMKMENSIEAPHSGTVTAIHVAKGDSVLEGAAVVTIG